MKKITYIACGLLLAGCGGLHDTMDATKKMPPKMDRMIGKMDLTNEGMSETIRRIEETNKKMEAMGVAIDHQTLGVATSALFAPESTRFLTPPARMMGPGRMFAEAAPPELIPALTSGLVAEVNYGQPDEERDDNGNFKPEVVRAADHHKMVSLTALEIINGYLPQAKVETMVKRELMSSEGGLNPQGALQALAFRAKFTKDMLLDKQYMPPNGIATIARAKTAVGLLKSLEYILALPFADKIGVKVEGMLTEGNNEALSFTLKDIVSATDMIDYWERIAKVDAELMPQFRKSPEVAAIKAAAEPKVRVWKEKSKAPMPMPMPAPEK